MTRLARFLDGFAPCLVRRAQVGHATRYVQGLLSDAKSKNMEGMISRLAEPGDYQSLQHFITHSTWDATKVWQRLGELVPEREGFLLIDDTGIPKQGKHSVGVTRQYCGALGKISNCQVVVTSALRTKHHTWPLAMHLFLPESWCEDDALRSKADVPSSFEHRTKIEMAVDQIDATINSGFTIRCVLADAGYGVSTDFRDAIAVRGLHYAVGIGKGTTAFTHPPQFDLDSPRSRTKLARGAAKPESIEAIADAAEPSEWQRIRWRTGTKGKLEADFLIRRVIPAHGWERGEKHDAVWLICERTLGHESVRKFHLSNLPPEIAPKELIRITHERWAIEMQYRDLKQEVGLDHFEGRNYPGFTRHLVLTALAYHFLQSERRRNKQSTLPSLNAVRRSVTEILTAMLFTLGERFASIVLELARSPPKT